MKGDVCDWMDQQQSGLGEVRVPWYGDGFVWDALAPHHQAVAWCQGDTVQGPTPHIC